MIKGTATYESTVGVGEHLSDAMADVALIMHEGIINLMESGNFTPKADGSLSTLGGRTGSIAQSLNHESTDRTATAGVYDYLPYSFIHNYGGHINVTEKQHSFFWWMFKQTDDEMWKAMALKYQPGDIIEMPRREYIAFTDEMITQIVERVKQNIIMKKNGETEWE